MEKLEAAGLLSKATLLADLPGALGSIAGPDDPKEDVAPEEADAPVDD